MTDKIYELLTKIGITRGQDKVLHFIAGFALGILGQIVFYDTILTIIPVIIGAVGKELYDDTIGDTRFNFFDMFTTLLGGFFGIVSYGLILG